MNEQKQLDCHVTQNVAVPTERVGTLIRKVRQAHQRLICRNDEELVSSTT